MKRLLFSIALLSWYLIPGIVQAQDTIFLYNDTIRVGELEWDMQKDWRARGARITENPDLYGDTVKIYLGYHANRMTEVVAFGYLDTTGAFLYHGPARYYYDSGHLLSKRYYVHGLENGPGRDFYKSGQVWVESFFQEGVLHGPYRAFYEDGTLEQLGRYEQGKLDGTLRSWYSNGVPRWREEYRDGVQVGGDTTYYETGVVQAAFGFEEGQMEGPATFFHRNGRAWARYHYHEGKLVAVDWIKSKEGRPLEVGTFKDGNGWLHIYNDNGLLIEKDKYRNGIKVKTKAIGTNDK